MRCEHCRRLDFSCPFSLLIAYSCALLWLSAQLKPNCLLIPEQVVDLLMLCFFFFFCGDFCPSTNLKVCFACRSLLAVQASVLELSPPPLLFSSILLFRLSSVARKRFSPLLPSDLLRRNGWRTSSSSCFASSSTTCTCLICFQGGEHRMQILRLYFSFVAGMPRLILY